MARELQYRQHLDDDHPTTMKPYAKLLQRLLNAMAFANAANFREFEELLEESDKRRLVQKRTTARHYGAAARRSRRPAAALPIPQF